MVERLSVVGWVGCSTVVRSFLEAGGLAHRCVNCNIRRSSERGVVLRVWWSLGYSWGKGARMGGSVEERGGAWRSAEEHGVRREARRSEEGSSPPFQLPGIGNGPLKRRELDR
jgi:hypothetical protein